MGRGASSLVSRSVRCRGGMALVWLGSPATGIATVAGRLLAAPVRLLDGAGPPDGGALAGVAE